MIARAVAGRARASLRICAARRYDFCMEAIATTRIIARNMLTLRRARGWTTERLAQELGGKGVQWKRGVVTKLETGRRESVSVDELLALGAVFGVEPMMLVRSNLTVTVIANG